MPDAPTSSISTIAGSYVDAKFSSDGSQLYAVSGNTVSVIDVATDQVVAQYSMGTQLGALDLSVDGHYLAVVENYASADTVYRIDLTSGAITSYAATLTTTGPFYDVAFLPDGSALVSQRAIGNGNPSLELLDFSTGTFSALASNMQGATLTTSADHIHVLIEPYGYQLASYLYVAGSGIVASATAGPSDPYGGAALPPTGNGVEATSPAGDMYVQGTTLNVYDSSMHLLPTPATDYPYLAGAQGLAFSPDGQDLYVAEGTMVVVFNTSNWNAIGAYSVDSSIAVSDDSISGKYVGFGDIVQVSPDGDHLSVITSNGIELIDLTSAQYASTPGDDTIAGTGAIYALAGNDDLTGTSSWGTWMYGGSGDTYHVNSMYDEPIELAGEGHDTVDSTVSFTLGGNIEDLILEGSNAINGSGNDLDNLIVGNSATNQLTGGAGNDHLEASGGDDTLDGGAGDDILDGGSGNDTVTYISALSGVSVDLSRTAPQNTHGAGTDTLISIENLTGSWQDDHLAGDAGANQIEGFAGNDVLTGGLGADTLVGGDGSDTFMDTAAGLNGDTLTDFSSADKIVITDANLNNFQFSLSGNVLTYSGGSLTFGTSVTGTIVASAARGGGVQLAIGPAQGATNDQIAEQLTSGYWAGDPHHWDVTQGGTLTVNMQTLTPDEQTLAIAALAEWTDIIGVQFQQVTSGGDIRFVDSGDTTGTDPLVQTYSYWSNGIITSAEVQITQSWVNEYGTSLNSYSFQTYVHEIGHALGLGHAGNYNVDATYPDDGLFVNDSWATSIMSYFSPAENTFFSSQGFSGLYSVTPMVADDVAMQTLYGLSTTTRLGDTVYGDHSNAGGMFDASVYPNVAVTIYDSGGNDTIDYSLSNAAQLINLNPETFSNVDGYIGNLEIARGAVIENAIGGSAPDVLIGNSAANVLTGNGGNDVLTGGGGGDSFLDTESGHNGDTITDFQVDDRIVFSDASLADFSFSLSGTTLTYSGGSMTLQDLPVGTLVAKAAPGGGVQLTIVPENVHNDFGGNGTSDMLLRDDSGWLTDWLGTGDGSLVNNGADLSMNLPADWHVVGTGDFNGDGRADVMLSNDSGWVTDWLGTYNGGLANNGATATMHFASNWQIAGTGDFNGDGISDFLFGQTIGGIIADGVSGGMTGAPTVGSSDGTAAEPSAGDTTEETAAEPSAGDTTEETPEPWTDPLGSTDITADGSFWDAALGGAQPTKPKLTYDQMLDDTIAFGTALKGSLNVDWEMLGEHEGELLQFYQPDKAGKGVAPDTPDPNSGVTVATGFDIGRHTPDELRAAFPAPLAAKLAPFAAYWDANKDSYVPLVGKAARDLLESRKAQGLVPDLSAKELRAIEFGSITYIARPIIQRYNAASGKRFQDLPRQAQTVLFDFSFQHGAYFPSKGTRAKNPTLAAHQKDVFDSIVKGDWSGAYAQLHWLQLNTQFKNRRADEANLIKQLTK